MNMHENILGNTFNNFTKKISEKVYYRQDQ